jgi:hypothetical protein
MTNTSISFLVSCARNIALFSLVIACPSLGKAQQYEVSMSARPVDGSNSFEAFVDARDIPRPLALQDTRLLVSCRAHDGSEQESWVQFHPGSLLWGVLYRKILPMPDPCASWNRLVGGRVAFSTGKADAESVYARVSVQQGTLPGSSTDLTPPSPEQTHVPPLPAPLLLYPPDGAVFSHYPRETVVFWSPSANAAYYVLEIEYGSVGEWNPYILVPNLQVTNHHFDFVGAQPGRWRVWAVSHDGRGGYASPWRHFSYTR